MILEGVITTLDKDGRPNIAPMGPIVDSAMQQLLLRPFQSTATFANLVQSRCGVLHVTDDVLLFARAVAGQSLASEETFAATAISGRVLSSACRWYEFTVEAIDTSADRADCRATIVAQGRLRDFFGFNRAKHAVIEAAILATRTHLLPEDQVAAEFARLRVPVEKTAGPAEREAFELLEDFVSQTYRASPCAKLS